MRILLDTHILVWLATSPRLLRRGELKVVESDANELFVSSISLWELRAKMRAERRRDRKELTLDPAGAIAFCDRSQIILKEVAAGDIAVELVTDSLHGDPFDEMLLLHTQLLGARLLTRDRNLVDHPLAY